MFAVHARYRGRSTHRAELVARSAEALSTLDGVGTFDVLGVEDICAAIDSARATTDTAMALLSAGEWAVSIGVTPLSNDTGRVQAIATAAMPQRVRAGTVKAQISAPGVDTADITEDIIAVFALLNHVFSKRTHEGREATALVRQGLNQNEAAEELGISKQAMSQRLQAAGWLAESAGWQLAVHLLQRADSLA
ncbi:MarR family transcriptional regulator [Corynebacterium sp. 11A]|uniref:MarR family transcriptional regulator n=1 Tax=Corynebacterium sp. 11A TaxID=2080510 RepID=UPI00124E6DB0|nr:MarR family transcriptional regulator [Corynebacterium sp. 11A]